MNAGCGAIYIDGSFVTNKESPNDFDACWDITGADINKIDPILRTFDAKRASQKAKYYGEFFPAQYIEKGSGKHFLDFLSTDKDGRKKGIVALDLRSFDYD
ncbi:MAG: hypothetical protein C4575_10715 [Desulforudis sp.]|nr:MAG: hypothetical protein C4575_10715 [Desulforudis sp.]